MINHKNHTIAILAYNKHKLTLKNLNHLISLGYRNNILLFDNGSDPSFKKISEKLNIQYHREDVNVYVNPALNKIFQKVDSKYLTLLNKNVEV